MHIFSEIKNQNNEHYNEHRQLCRAQSLYDYINTHILSVCVLGCVGVMLVVVFCVCTLPKLVAFWLLVGKLWQILVNKLLTIVPNKLS